METLSDSYFTNLVCEHLFLVLSASLMVIWAVYIVLYRLYLSPVSRIPGPRLAALTFWYEFYYDVISKGQYTFKIKELHKKYGPVIRINPYEVHIDDPEFYDQVYVGAATRPTDKWAWSANMFTVPTSTISTIPHTLHRRRRAMFANHFSTGSVQRIDAVIRRKIDRLMERLDQAERERRAVSLAHAYSALTMDIITTYSFAKSVGTLDRPEFAKEYNDMFARTSLASHFSKQFGWLIDLLKRMPQSLIQYCFTDQALIFDLQKGFTATVLDTIERRQKASEQKDNYDLQKLGLDKTVFDSMLDAKVPEEEKTVKRLAEEAQLIVIAGTLTTAHTLMTISYHLLTNPQYLKKLKQELLTAEAEAMSSETQLDSIYSTIPLKRLESLPYLNAVIREGLRVGYGTPHRLQRVSPTTTLSYHGYTFPSGTPLSMSAMLMHDNETLFPNPEHYNPERWLPLDTTGAHLNKYLVPFSKGSRQCVGMNLAWAELYLTIAAVFGGKGKEMRLYDTVFERDIKTTIDGFNPLTTLGSNGLQVMIGKE